MGRFERFAACSLKDFSDLKELYRSGAGAVYRATFKYDNKEYVLKERILSELGKRKNITNEVQLLSQLNHPNVIRCEGWFWDHKKAALVIVLEFCENGDLYKLIQKRKARSKYFDEAYIWYMFHQICLGVCHLHENGIIHRDLKALNIMLTRGNTVAKLADLGVSRQVSEDTMMLKTFYGTPLYLSPELVDNSSYNEKTDIWSLGVLLYEFAALRCPFRSQTLLGLAKTIKRGVYDPLPEHFSGDLGRCIKWLLNVDYTKRPHINQVIRWIEDRLVTAPMARRVLADVAEDDTDDEASEGTVDDDEQAEMDPPIDLPDPNEELQSVRRVDLASGRKSDRRADQDAQRLTASSMPPQSPLDSPAAPTKIISQTTESPAHSLSKQEQSDIKVNHSVRKQVAPSSVVSSARASARKADFGAPQPQKDVPTAAEPKILSRRDDEEKKGRHDTAAKRESFNEVVESKSDPAPAPTAPLPPTRAPKPEAKEKVGAGEEESKVKATEADYKSVRVNGSRLEAALRKQVSLYRRLMQTRSLMSSVETVTTKKTRQQSSDAAAGQARLVEINTRIAACDQNRVALEAALETGFCDMALALSLGLLDAGAKTAPGTPDRGAVCASRQKDRARPKTASVLDDSNYPSHHRLVRKDDSLGVVRELHVDAALRVQASDGASFRRGPAEHSLFGQGDNRLRHASGNVGRGMGMEGHSTPPRSSQLRPRTAGAVKAEQGARYNIIRQSYC